MSAGATATRIEVWSDVVCPWCYLGKRRLERALEGLGLEGVEVEWRAFQLQPDAPAFGDPGAGAPTTELLRARGLSPDQVAEMNDRVSALAAEEGLRYRLEGSRVVNTFDAHRLIKMADVLGLADPMVERLFRAQLVEGRRVDDTDLLVELAAEVGVDDAEEALASRAGAGAVEADLAAARELGVGGVPLFVFDRRLALSGAQPVEVFERALSEIEPKEGPS